MYLVVIPTCFLSICRRLIVFPLNFFSSFTYCFPLKNSFIFFQPIVWGQFRRQLYCGWFKDHSVAKSRDWITGKPFSYLFILCSLLNKHILSSKYFFMFRLVITITCLDKKKSSFSSANSNWGVCRIWRNSWQWLGVSPLTQSRHQCLELLLDPDHLLPSQRPLEADKKITNILYSQNEY